MRVATEEDPASSKKKKMSMPSGSALSPRVISPWEIESKRLSKNKKQNIKNTYFTWTIKCFASKLYSWHLPLYLLQQRSTGNASWFWNRWFVIKNSKLY